MKSFRNSYLWIGIGFIALAACACGGGSSPTGPTTAPPLEGGWSIQDCPEPIGETFNTCGRPEQQAPGNNCWC
jgi:hypothetical protein